MKWVLGALLGMTMAELMRFTFLLSIVRRMMETMGRALRTFRLPGASDNWKEKAMLMYSKILFRETSKLALFFGIAVLLLVSINWIVSFWVSDFGNFLVSLAGVFYMTSVALFYLFLRNKIGSL